MIIIKDSAWNVIKEINPDISKSLHKQITEAWVDIPAACYTWVCGACMCEIESWAENIDKNAFWEEWFPTWNDEVMTCIAWLKDKDKDIILKKVY